MDWISDLPWGDVSEWANALVTGFALWFARGAVKKSGDMLQIEQERDRKRDERDTEQLKAAEQAAQADYVAAWHHYIPGDQSLKPSFAFPKWAARVLNNSPLPVWDVQVDFIGPDGTLRGSVGIPVVQPGERDVQWPVDELRRPAGTDETGKPIYIESRSEFAVALSFRDAAGRRWRRDENGILTFAGRVSFMKMAATLRRKNLVGSTDEPDDGDA